MPALGHANNAYSPQVSSLPYARKGGCCSCSMMTPKSVLAPAALSSVAAVKLLPEEIKQEVEATPEPADFKPHFICEGPVCLFCGSDSRNDAWDILKCMAHNREQQFKCPNCYNVDCGGLACPCGSRPLMRLQFKELVKKCTIQLE